MPKQPPDPLDRIGDLVRVEQLRTSGEARRIRLDAGLPAQEIADAVGVHVSSVLGWEEGLKRPRAKVALAWLRVLDRIKAETERGEQGEPPVPSAVGEGSRRAS